MVLNAIKEFWKHEAVGGCLLFVAAVAAVVCANTGLEHSYEALREYPISIAGLSLHAIHWANDALMAVFFLLVGMEIKREVVVGELSSRSRLALPLVGAAGGMLLPALLYLMCNGVSSELTRGWAIPSATDIAFAIGVLSLFSSRVPTSLKVFLTALAILDDLGAIVIIAFFYTAHLNIFYLGLSFVALAALVFLNIFKVRNLLPYLLGGIVLWILVFHSGIHATLAGVALALTIPLNEDDKGNSPLAKLSHALHPYVTFLILPVFGFLNAGVSLNGFGPESLLSPLPLGIALGLFFGKQLGVFGFAWLAVKSKLAEKPRGATWGQFYAVSIVTGIGFTMSLFIGGLAFHTRDYEELVRVGVITGSIASIVIGAIVLQLTLPHKRVE